jgi:geranylgeranyl pyrophosphate synthase
METEREPIADYIKRRAEKVNVKINRYLTDKSSVRYLETLLGRSGYSYDRRAIEKAVLEPSRYLFGRGGKRVRAVLMLTIMDALGKDSEEFIEFSLIPEVIHNGTLIHDDIEDASDMRRGAESIHVKYGLDVALNLGDFMFFFPVIALLDSKKTGRDQKMKVLEIYQREMLRLSIGQATDIAWHNNSITADSVSEPQYLEMAYLKTGVLTGMAAKIAGVLCGADDQLIEALGKFGATLGVAFQLQDDILNMSESRLSDLKGGAGEDVTEGKVTLLTVKTFETAEKGDRDRLKAILEMHTKDPGAIDEARSIIRKYNAEEYVRQLQLDLMKNAWESVDRLVKDSEAKTRLKEMADFLINRTV